MDNDAIVPLPGHTPPGKSVSADAGWFEIKFRRRDADLRPLPFPPASERGKGVAPYKNDVVQFSFFASSLIDVSIDIIIRVLIGHHERAAAHKDNMVHQR